MNHFQAVEQILAELAFLDLGLEIFVGGRHDSDVDRKRHPAAYSLDDSLLQRPQDLGLTGQVELPNLVEEQGAAVGRFELSGAAVDSSGDAFLDAKQLGLEKSLGQGGAVERDERAVGSGARLVDGFRDQFLSGPAFTADKNVDVGIPNLPDQP